MHVIIVVFVLDVKKITEIVNGFKYTWDTC